MVFIQGDHGSGEIRFENMQEEGLRDVFSILLAIHAPSLENDVFYEDLTPVNTFRLIFNNHFGDDFPILEERHYKTQPESPWKFVDITDIIQED